MRRILRGYIVNQGGMLNVEVVEVVEKKKRRPLRTAAFVYYLHFCLS